MLTTAVCTVQVSKACTSICMWVRAMYKYHTVALSVAPKRAALAQAQGQLDATLAELAAAQAKLQARLSCLCLGCVRGCVSVCVCVSVSVCECIVQANRHALMRVFACLRHHTQDLALLIHS